MSETSYTLKELAEVVGQAARTIRYYIAEGLLPAPNQAGRNAQYDAGHRERLESIARLKREGLTLAEIALRLEPEQQQQTPELPAATPLGAIALSNEVQALVRTDLAPWQMKKVRRILAEAARQLQNLESEQ